MLALYRLTPAAALAMVIAFALPGCGKSKPTGIDAELAEYLGPPEDVRLTLVENGTFRIRPTVYRQRVAPFHEGRVGVGYPLNLADNSRPAKYREPDHLVEAFELWVEDGKLWRRDGADSVMLEGPLTVNAKTWPQQPDEPTRGRHCTITAKERLTIADRQIDTLEVTCLSAGNSERVDRNVWVFGKGYGLIGQSYGVTRPTAVDRYDIAPPETDLVLTAIEPLIGKSAQ